MRLFQLITKICLPDWENFGGSPKTFTNIGKKRLFVFGKIEGSKAPTKVHRIVNELEEELEGGTQKRIGRVI